MNKVPIAVPPPPPPGSRSGIEVNPLIINIAGAAPTKDKETTMSSPYVPDGPPVRQVVMSNKTIAKLATAITKANHLIESGEVVGPASAQGT